MMYVWFSIQCEAQMRQLQIYSNMCATVFFLLVFFAAAATSLVFSTHIHTRAQVYAFLCFWCRCSSVLFISFVNLLAGRRKCQVHTQCTLLHGIQCVLLLLLLILLFLVFFESAICVVLGRNGCVYPLDPTIRTQHEDFVQI